MKICRKLPNELGDKARAAAGKRPPTSDFYDKKEW